MSSSGPPPPDLRFTLGQVMVAVAVAALLCTATMGTGGTIGPRGVEALRSLSILAGFALGLLTIVVTVYSLSETFFGVSCPNCVAPALARVAMQSFGYRYYRCTTCGSRCKRRPWMTWEDASEPEDDAFYQLKTDAGPPGLVPGRDDETSWQGSTGALLRSQRSRKPPPVSSREDATDPRTGLEPETDPDPDQAGSSGSTKTRETGAPG